MKSPTLTITDMIETFRQRLQEAKHVDIAVRVRPHAPKSKVVNVLMDDSIKIDLAAAAEDNEANIELVQFLAETFDVATSNITILSGKTARLKLVRIAL